MRSGPRWLGSGSQTSRSANQVGKRNSPTAVASFLATWQLTVCQTQATWYHTTHVQLSSEPSDDQFWFGGDLSSSLGHGTPTQAPAVRPKLRRGGHARLRVGGSGLETAFGAGGLRAHAAQGRMDSLISL